MKNKFLLMAVISALAALVIVPSTMAATTDSSDTTIGASVTSGEFVLTAEGVYGEEIDFGGVSVSSLAQPKPKVNGFTSMDYFELYDYDTGLDSSSIVLGLKQNFRSLTDSFDANNLKIGVHYEADVPAAAECLKDSWTKGCNIVTARTSPLAFAVSNYTLGASYTTSPFYTVGESGAFNKQILSTTDLAYPYVVQFGLSYMGLTIPANQTPGRYTSVIYVLASQS